MIILNNKFVIGLRVKKEKALIATFSLKLGDGKANYVNCRVFNQIFIAKLQTAQEQLDPTKQALVITISGFLQKRKEGKYYNTFIVVENMILNFKETTTRIQQELNQIEQERLNYLNESTRGKQEND